MDSDSSTPFGSPQPRPRPPVDFNNQAGLLLGADDNSSRPPLAGRESSSGHSRHRLNLAFPLGSHGAEGGSVSPVHRPLSAAHSPNHSYNHSYSHSHSHSHSYNQQGGPRVTPSRDGRSYSRQSIEEILHNALTERDTEGSTLNPSNSRFSFQSTTSSARLGKRTK